LALHFITTRVGRAFTTKIFMKGIATIGILVMKITIKDTPTTGTITAKITITIEGIDTMDTITMAIAITIADTATVAITVEGIRGRTGKRG
jgi:hypothetical protein